MAGSRPELVGVQQDTTKILLRLRELRVQRNCFFKCCAGRPTLSASDVCFAERVMRHRVTRHQSYGLCQFLNRACSVSAFRKNAPQEKMRLAVLRCGPDDLPKNRDRLIAFSLRDKIPCRLHGWTLCRQQTNTRKRRPRIAQSYYLNF